MRGVLLFDTLNFLAPGKCFFGTKHAFLSFHLLSSTVFLEIKGLKYLYIPGIHLTIFYFHLRFKLFH